MKKIENQQDVQRKKKRTQVIVAIVLGLILLGSSFGVIIDSFGNTSSGKIKYQGITFTKDENNFWITQKEGNNLIFFYNPMQTENVSSKVDTIEKYYSLPLYIYSENQDAEGELYRNLDPRANSIVERVQTACPEDKTCDVSIVKKDCTNNFIIIEYSENESLEQKQNCVYIRGKSKKMLELTDEYLFKLFKIKQ